jgi:RNA polymerase sigma-70 factor (ECF subfamily)
MDSTADALRISASAGSPPDPISATVAVGGVTLPVPRATEQLTESIDEQTHGPAGDLVVDADGSTERARSPEARLSAVELEDWFATHHAGVYRYAYRLSGQHAIAEDLTQQTFMTALGHGGTVRSPQAVRSWLLKVCRRLFVRSLAREGWVASGLETDALTAKEPPPERDADTRDLLQTGIAALPEEYRLVVLMFFFEDASYREIADELGVPVGTVMSRLSRAKARLRSALGPADVKGPA